MPVFSSASIQECFLDLILPSTPHMVHKKIVSHIPWKEKKFKAFWRGAVTGTSFNDGFCP